MKLHLGCGTRSIPGYINIDARVDLDNTDLRCRCNPNVVDDITKLDKFENGCASVIFFCHGFEHIRRSQRFDVLKRWKDVLKIGGVLRLAVPNFEMVARCYLDKSVPFEMLWSALNGSDRHPYDIHYHCYDFDHLKKDLEFVGFSNVRWYDWRKTDHAEIDDFSQAYWPHMDKKNGKLLSLNVECDKLS